MFPKAVLRRAAIASLIGAVSALHAFADTPEAMLEELIGKIKSQQNASPVVDYVDWKSAFDQAPAQQKQIMDFSSPDEMKAVYREALENPTKVFKKQVEARIGEAPEEQRAMMQSSLSRLEEMMKQKEAEMKEKIAGTEYKIGETNITGDTAQVQLTQTYKGQTSTETVKLVKSGERWLLPAVGMFGAPQQQQGAPAGAPGGGSAPAHPPHGAPAGAQ